MIYNLVQNFKYAQEEHTKEEWIKLFYEEYIKFNSTDRIFINFFVPNTKEFDKKIQYMSEMLTKGKTDVSIYDIIENYTNDLWD